MALRLLMYIARVYEKIVGDKNIYTTKSIAIPRPEFFVLYNGLASYPDETVLKLSDAFESTALIGLPDKGNPALELTVRVININEGRNEAIVRKCRILSEYSAFIGKAREFEKEVAGKNEAMKKTVRYCREHDILREFLEQNGTEVMNMLMTEWKMEDALEVRFEEGMEKGMEKGKEEIARNALSEGFSIEIVQKITGLDMETIKSLS